MVPSRCVTGLEAAGLADAGAAGGEMLTRLRSGDSKVVDWRRAAALPGAGVWGCLFDDCHICEERKRTDGEVSKDSIASRA